MAFTTSEDPLIASPAANTHGSLVWWLSTAKLPRVSSPNLYKSFMDDVLEAESQNHQVRLKDKICAR
jgi:hypothetical protein